jgi:hypothetical protein
MENIIKVYHKGPAADPVFGTYTSLHLRYTTHTQTVAFADDLVIII